MSKEDKRIRELAHQIWESEGKPDGAHDRHWEMARKLAEAEALTPLDPVDVAEDEQALELDAKQLADPTSGSQVPPWSASHPYVNLYGHKAPVTATVAGNFRVTALGTDSDTHHIVLDFGSTPFPVLEGQSIGILPPDRIPLICSILPDSGCPVHPP